MVGLTREEFTFIYIKYIEYSLQNIDRILRECR